MAVAISGGHQPVWSGVTMSLLRMRRRPALAPLFGNRGLLAIVVAGGLSSVGDWLYLTALPVLLFLRSGDLGLLGLVAVIRLVPFLLLSLPAGALADRVPPARVLIASESIRGLAMATAALVVVLDVPLAWLIAMAAISSIAGTVSMPAQGTLLPELAPTTRSSPWRTPPTPPSRVSPPSRAPRSPLSSWWLAASRSPSR